MTSSPATVFPNVSCISLEQTAYLLHHAHVAHVWAESAQKSLQSCPTLQPQGLSTSLLCLLHWQAGSLPLIHLRSLREAAVLCLVSQSCPSLCNPVDCSPSGSSVHGDSPGKSTGVGCHALLQGIFPTQGSNPCLFCLLHW